MWERDCLQLKVFSQVDNAVSRQAVAVPNSQIGESCYVDTSTNTLIKIALDKILNVTRLVTFHNSCPRFGQYPKALHLTYLAFDLLSVWLLAGRDSAAIQQLTQYCLNERSNRWN
jgi:hypothetical protein